MVLGKSKGGHYNRVQRIGRKEDEAEGIQESKAQDGKWRRERALI